jgi:predicted dehydrogenase
LPYSQTFTSPTSASTSLDEKMTSPHTCRWGILSTGWIANKFTLDLLVDPSTRQVSDVRHEVVAIGSRSKESAQRFLDATWKEAGVSTGKENVKLYASYGELFRDEVGSSPSLPDI